MKIKTKLLVSAAASIALVIALGLVVFFTAREVDEARAKDETTHQMLQRISELNIVASDYLMYGGERARTQWYSSYDSLGQLVSEDEFAESISMDFEAMGATFAQLVTAREVQTAGDADTAAAEAYEARLMAKLSLYSQSMTSDAVLLADASRADISSTQQRATVLVLALIGLLLAIMVGTGLAVFLSIANPITRL
ncbi:unnamed protein product, partial [marine sediment metagenome]